MSIRFFTEIARPEIEEGKGANLLGSLNPLRLFKRDYRASFRGVWQQEPRVFRIGYVLGAIVLMILFALAVFVLWRSALY